MKKICLVAVNIRSTHNIGSIFRSADGFSADVILTGICPRPLGSDKDERLPHVSRKAHDAIHKTALGAEINVNWRYFSDTKQAIETLKNEGYSIVAIEQHKSSSSLQTLKTSSPTALLVGPEVEGLPNSILEMCDSIYEIPMSGEKESYNVSVAAGIALYQATIY